MQPLTVVLVEDSLTIRRQVIQRLETVPYLRIVGEASDESTAIALVGHTQPHAVLLDLSLAKGGSGLNVLKTLRKQGYTGLAYVLSHQTPEAYRAACVAAGANGFFDKASEMDLLLQQMTGEPMHSPRPLASQVLMERLDQTAKLAIRDGEDVAVHVLIGDAAAMPSLAAQLAASMDAGDLLGWLGEPGDGRLCVVRPADDDEPPLRDRVDALAPEVRTGRAVLPGDALSGGGLISTAELRALGLLPA